MINDEYQVYLKEIAATFEKSCIDSNPPTLSGVVDLLTPTQNNRLIRDLCQRLNIATKREFDQEVKRARQRSELGAAPCNARELVAAYIARHKVSMTFSESFTREYQARSESGETITQADREACEEVRDYAEFVCDSKKTFNRLDLERELRMLSDELHMAISERAISDAVEQWAQDAKAQRIYDIFGALSYLSGAQAQSRTEKVWHDVATKLFDCEANSPEYVIAVFKKFMWQVKRKGRGLPISNHLMPVILGGQGVGKSEFVRKMLDAVSELTLNVDFSVITDDRNIDIWQSYVLFLDEMGYATKTDIDTVKNIITASNLTRRPMRTNTKITVQQRATMIGCSNKELSQLIRDETGNRRFAPLRMIDQARQHRPFINSVNWASLWASVDERGADPMTDLMGELADQQSASRVLGKVEQWMSDYSGHVGWIRFTELYGRFREYEDRNYPSIYKTSYPDWKSEMRRLMKNSAETMMFESRVVNGHSSYRWKGTPNEVHILIDSLREETN